MATEILPVESGEAESGDVVVAPGAQITVGLMGESAPAVGSDCAVDVLIKGSDDKFWRVGELRSGVETCSLVIVGSGTYRFIRQTGTCGVFRD